MPRIRLPFLAAFALTAAACWSNATTIAPAPREQLTASEAEASRIEEVLVGKAPGLTVQRRADGTYTVRLRGSRAPGGGEPLLLLDGVPMAGPAGPALAEIDPRQVERVEVIRDAASLALYGPRGANGVIAIVTRHH